VPMWEPLQKGWFFDLPQLHQKYFLFFSNCILAGSFFAINGRVALILPRPKFNHSITNGEIKNQKLLGHQFLRNHHY